MEIRLAKTAGFCFGVRRAVDKVYEQVEKKKQNIYTFGPIIHNEEVVTDLESKGVKVLNSSEELNDIETGTVVIRSHGVPDEIYEKIREKNLECVDATCPYVKKIHRIVQEKSQEGMHIVILGNANHPEIEGIKGYCNSNYSIIGTEEEAHAFQQKVDQKLCLVSQTTFNYKKFKDLVEIMLKKGYDIIVLNTICKATAERQAEAVQIASGVDVMIVIGGSHSSNTRKLYEICKEECENTYYIQKLCNLELDQFQSAQTVGITAGASTPNNIIEEVTNNVRIKF